MNDARSGMPPGRAPEFDAASYERLDMVQRGSTQLKLQVRHDIAPSYYCLTWRETRLSGTNRRFYFEKGAFWTIEADKAYSMIAEAQRLRLMSTEYCRWPGKPPTVRDSAKLPPPEQQVLFHETLVNGDEDRLWHGAGDTRVVACTEPWNREVRRKVMVLSVRENQLTFRVLTTFPSDSHTYKRFVPANGWRISKSMLDADVTIHEVWLGVLDAIYGTKY